jgi:type I restriction-modification system DNA methylase subunit
MKTPVGGPKSPATQVLYPIEKTVLVNTQTSNKVNTTGEYAQADSSPKSVASAYSDSTSYIPIRRTRAQAIKENALALEIVNASDFESRILTSDESVILENYAGVGGQYEEGNQANNIDALTQFYTPDFICEKLYNHAYTLGFPKDGKVLEPSCGVGRLIKHAPDESKVTAFEISDIPYKISTKLYPKASIYHKYFEQAFLKEPRYTDVIRGTSPTWIHDYPFDLVIGNPPYGKHKNKWQSFFGNPKFPQIEFFFMYYAAKLLRPGGLLIYITSSNFIRTGGSHQIHKEKVLELLNVVGAYRMPNKFMELTDVGTDILFFRKK